MAATKTSPESTASEKLTSGGEWRKRSFAASAVKLLAFLVPVAASLSWTIIMGNVLSEPSTLGEHIAWWVAILGGAIAVAIVVEKIARRMLPMAMLLHLSLVFPEAAPSRFGMALRANSTRQLKRRIESGVVDEDSTPQEAATALLELSAALSVHDRMTRGHAERVRAYSVMIGEQFDLSDDELQKLQWGAVLHDVGKLDVSADILNKPAAPDPEELKSLRAHPDRGRDYMKALDDWLGPWALAASQHHERFDGNGYPNGLAGDEISLAARIVSVADAYDVMTSTRSYKTAMDPQEARAELLECSDTQFDPEVVRAFLSVPVSELRRPFQAALGAGALTSLAQVAEIRTIATAGTAMAGAAAVALLGGAEPPPEAIAFADSMPTALEILEDRPIEIPLRTTIDADSFAVDSVDGPATATINEDVLRIEPFEEASGTVTVVVTACGTDICDTTAIVAEVVAVNDPPLASADEATITPSLDSISIPVVANDTDVDDASLFIRSAELSDGDGQVAIVANGQELLFTPDPGSIGPWMIEYVVSDDGDGFDRGTVTILDQDLAPEANDDTATVVAGETVTVDVRANDQDDGGANRLEVISAVAVAPEDTSATVSVLENNSIEFVAGPNVGVVTVEYTVRDRIRRESSARVLVAVTPPLPEANDDSATTQQDTPVTVSVLDNDGPAILDLSSVELNVLSSSEGEVSVNGGDVTYTPPSNAAGEAAITYEICAAEGLCDTAQIRITVTRTVSPFAAEGQIALPSSAGPQIIPWVIVSSGDSVIAPGTTFSISTDRPSLFASAPTISQNGALSFNPKNDAVGTATSTITVNDSNGRRQYRLAIVIQ